MTKNTTDLREQICEIFSVFPEELEHNLPGGIGLKKVLKLEQLISNREKLAREDELKRAVYVLHNTLADQNDGASDVTDALNAIEYYSKLRKIELKSTLRKELDGDDHAK